ncbi:MAG TPA: DegT/DnrJ/EryC1/StrS family aminotransferase, partial [Pseudoneobacillus sp.]|nr:DegT/DnrJ/EryC1/StrS family aminotransferase [Pseudoneobacillus sp.]
MDRQIHVSRPFFPPLGEYEIYLEQIWKSGIVTHNGPMVQDLEKKLKELLKVRHIACVSNGTLAIQLAIKALNLQGEIITTPFTFIATISSVIWEKCKPVFVDINPYTLNIDENKIEEKITDNTVGILGVHVFSNPCNTDRIDEIAKKYHLKVIYDAAHAMHVEYKGKSIFEYGDISTTSFHGTKIFNTIEGGACFSNDVTLDGKIRELRFFGQDVNKEIVNEGTNA